MIIEIGHVEAIFRYPVKSMGGERIEAAKLGWGGLLSFGEGYDAPAITVTMRDVRCSMVNLDPDSASPAPEVLKAVVRANRNTAGIYSAVTRIGRLAVGQTILLRAATEKRN